MTIYLVNFALIIFYWMVSKELKKRGFSEKQLNTFFLVIIALQMIFIIGLRSLSVGIDSKSYYRRFNRYRLMEIKDIFADTSQEKGFSLLIRFVGQFTERNVVFQIVSATVSIAPIIITINKCSKKPFLSILLFIAFDYYAFMFSGIRQAIAYGLCFLSYLFIKNKKPVKFLLLVLLAAQFHKSAYMFLPAYFLASIKANNKNIGIILILFAVVFVFKNSIYDFIENTLYFTEHRAYERNVTNPFGIILLILGVTIISILFKDNAIKKDKSFNCCLLILCAGAILLPFISLGSNAKRIVEYYCMFLILVIPGILDGIEDEKIYKIANVATVFAAVVLFARYLMVDGYSIVPYIMA